MHGQVCLCHPRALLDASPLKEIQIPEARLRVEAASALVSIFTASVAGVTTCDALIEAVLKSAWWTVSCTHALVWQ